MTGRVALFLIGIAVVVPIGFGVALFFPARFPNGTATPVRLTVDNGATPQAIGAALAKAEVIGSPLLFRIAVKLRGGGDRLLAGDYAFPHGLSPWSAVAALKGDRYRSNETSVTIPEGFTRKQIADRLDAAGVVAADDFLAATADPSAALRALVPELPAGATLEGYLFPDTYRFLKRTAADAVVRKFLENFAAKRKDLPSATGSADGRTFPEIVTLASIVEAEVRTARDRALAADLFWRRIALGIALQSDATVNFVTGKSTPQVSLEDTEVDSPYNTYRNRGLPPGPIGNPGVESLRASLAPEPNDYLYFLTPPDGTTVFSETFEEHVANKARYLR